MDRHRFDADPDFYFNPDPAFPFNADELLFEVIRICDYSARICRPSLENERFAHVFAKTGSINSGPGQYTL